ncbi:MAG: hypothetical protein ACI835_003867 [Planctomycetota bacterium]|jgi:hypothetical protein
MKTLFLRPILFSGLGLTISLFTLGLAVAFLGSSCSSGGGGGGGGDGATLEGLFIDSAVGGMFYESGDLSGLTDSAGTFEFEEGENVQFSIGGIELPLVAGDIVLTPLQLVDDADDHLDPTVTNVARFLQTIDDDQDPSNGITISAAVRAGAADMSLDFETSIADFAVDPNVTNAISVLTFITSAGERALVSASSAQNHLQTTILGAFAGSYSGTFNGDDSGTFALGIDASGVITGTGDSNDEGSFAISGTADASGATDLLGGSVSTGATFGGEVHLDGTISGTWENAFFGDNGNWSGSKD